MKVAAVYTGLPRTYKYCIDNHRKSFWKKYNIEDCFLHFWHEDNKSLPNFAPWSEGTMPSFVTTSEDIVNTFKPKGYILEPNKLEFSDKKLKYPYDFNSFTKNEILIQCYRAIQSNASSINKAYNLIKNLDYDYFVVCRPDMLWDENLNSWPELNGVDNYYYWDTLWIINKEIFKIFAIKEYNIEAYIAKLLRDNQDHETQNYNFITSEAVNDLHFKTYNIDLSKFIPIKMKKQIHRGFFIQN